MFDWDRFKQEKFAVHCDTEEKAKDFLKECNNKGMIWGTGDSLLNENNWGHYKESTYYRLYGSDKRIYFGNVDWDESRNIKIIKWEIKEMKELTFKEVIANIKEGEVWENSLLKIRLLRTGYIDIENAMGWENGTGISIMADLKFTLQRKEYTFEEAFKAYEEGKEIESLYSEDKFKINKKLCHNSTEWRYCETFKTGEIRGKWYIND